MKIFVFDVDGTLTAPRQPITEGFANFFKSFCKHNIVFLISGSDLKKIKEQLPEPILNACYGVFTCSGAEYYEKSLQLYSKTHEFPAQLIALCEEFVEKSSYPDKTGNHIEYRPGMLNVSSVGRNATHAQRQTYYHWDKSRQERSAFAERLNALDLGYEVTCGGEISLDIVPGGWNKSVAKKEILGRLPAGEIVFFGDRIVQGGNDMPLAQALEDDSGIHRSFKVESFKDTLKILLNYEHLRLQKFAA